MVELEGVTLTHPGGVELAFPDWRVEPGEQWHLVGPSGCGKTSLLHLIAGLLTPTRGTLRVLDQPDWGRLPQRTRDRLRGRHIGLVFQRAHLLPALSVLENLLLARSLVGLPRRREHAMKLLEAVGLQQHAHARPGTLSGGELQRAAIARAAVNAPDLLLADEPTASLDDARCWQSLELLCQVAHDAGAALIIASHDRRVGDVLDKSLVLAAQGRGSVAVEGTA